MRIIALFIVTALLFGTALYFGWIGHRSVEWDEFKREFLSSEFSDVHFTGRKIVAVYRDGRASSPLIVYTPTDPLPENERRWFMVKALKHGVNLVFD